MRKTVWMSLTSGLGVAALLAPVDTLAGNVKETSPTCMTATAIMMVSDGADDARPFEVIRELVRSNKNWTLIASPEPNVTDRIAITRWSIKHTYKGGPTTAYTAQCGHGGTCNAIAHLMADRFPQMVPAPQVFCGDVGNVLENPTPAPMP